MTTVLGREGFYRPHTLSSRGCWCTAGARDQHLRTLPCRLLEWANAPLQYLPTDSDENQLMQDPPGRARAPGPRPGNWDELVQYPGNALTQSDRRHERLRGSRQG